MANNAYARINFPAGLADVIRVLNLESVTTTEMNALTPVSSRLVYNETVGKLAYYTGSAWVLLPTDADISAALEGLAWKDSVVAASTGNVDIPTGLNSGDLLDDVTLADGNRTLLKDQTDATENGIYIVGATPVRAVDMSASAEFNSAIVTVDAGGTANGETTWRCQTIDPVLGTDDIIFVQFGASVPDATDTVKGKVELATSAEVITGTDTTRAITPAGLAATTYKVTVASIANAATYDIVHNLNTSYPIAQAYDSTGNQSLVGLVTIDANTLRFTNEVGATITNLTFVVAKIW